MIANIIINAKKTQLTEPSPFSLWSWGLNANYQLGNNSSVSRSSPVQAGNLLTSWISVTAGDFHGLGIRGNNTLWGWGDSTYGEMGRGTTSTNFSPRQVGTLSNWSQVATGNNHVIAVKTDGTLWSWGFNSSGELGMGDNTNRSSPVQVGLDTNWSKVSCGANHSLAIKTNGTLWAWGANTAGETGHGIGYGIGVNGILSPRQVGVDSNWAEIAGGNYFSLAVKTDGTLWAWGDNPNGNLGTGNTTDYSIPTQVGALTNWRKIAASNNQTGTCHSLAVKTDGTLWAWGIGSFGALGNGSTTDRSSPVQIGTENGWIEVDAGDRSSIALRQNGTIWTWGQNANGQLGLSDTTDRSSPVQVGTVSTWYRVMAGRYQMHALRK